MRTTTTSPIAHAIRVRVEITARFACCDPLLILAAGVCIFELVHDSLELRPRTRLEQPALLNNSLDRRQRFHRRRKIQPLILEANLQSHTNTEREREREKGL